MLRLLPPRMVLCLVVLGLSVLAPALSGGGAAFARKPPPAEWQAVLIAGDNAQPVFDNAVIALTHWLEARGVPTGDIHRLSASPHPGDVAVAPASDRQVLETIAALRPRHRERCLVFITSHGQRGEGIWLAESGDFLEPAALARALSAGCGAVPTVVIMSSCYSGEFTAMRAPNRIVMTAARADRPSFGCQADRTYTVYDECLLAALPRAHTWRAVYASSSACVRRREKWLNVLPSQPQASFGMEVGNLSVR